MAGCRRDEDTLRLGAGQTARTGGLCGGREEETGTLVKRKEKRGRREPVRTEEQSDQRSIACRRPLVPGSQTFGVI